VRSLLFRTMGLVFGALAAFALVLGLIMALGSAGILASWAKRENRNLDAFIRQRLTTLAAERAGAAREASAPFGESDVREALEGMPADPDWVLVLDAEGRALYFYRQAMSAGEMRMGAGRSFIRRIMDSGPWREVAFPDGRRAFRYSAYVPPFDTRESNRILLATVRLGMVWGLAAAALVGALLAYLFARPLGRQAGQLAETLEAMRSGRRDLKAPVLSVSELDRIGRAAESLQGALAHEEELRRQWAADIAHDLRSPLAALKGQVEGMADGVFAPDARRLALIQGELGRLESLVQAFSLLTRLESPGFRPERRPLSALDLIREAQARFAPMAAERGSTISVSGAETELEADPALLERAIANLVDNALRYGRAGGPVRLACGRGPDGRAFISVENEGFIDPAVLPRVFDRSFRSDPSRSAEGSGLGLTIARAIAQAHGAEIKASSDPASGLTSFIISFT